MRRLAGATTSGVLRIRRREEVYRDLLMRFFVLLKTTQSRDCGGDAWHNSLGDFYAQLLPILERETTLFLSERDGYLYANAIRVRIDADGFASQRFLVRELVQSQLSGVIFERGASQEDVTRFVQSFLHRDVVQGESIEQVLRARGCKRIHVLPRSESALADARAAGEAEQSELAAPSSRFGVNGRTYFKSILIFRHLLGCLGSDCIVPRDEVQDLLQVLVKRLLGCEDGRIALDLVRAVESERIGQALRVAVPAMALARRYGMSEFLASEFGIATLLAGVLRRRGDDGVDPLERQQVLHLVAGGGASGLLLLSALCGWEEHDEAAASGDADPSVASRVLRITRDLLEFHESRSQDASSLEDAVASWRAHGYDSELVDAVHSFGREMHLAES